MEQNGGKAERVVRTVCEICDAGCNVDAYIRDGKVVKVSGCKNPAYGNGFLCARGYANRPYIYHAERVKTPLRRTGERGSGRFEPISWEEALSEIGKHLLSCREKYGPSGTMFYGGFSEWDGAALQRLSRSFGSVNYAGAYCSAACAADIAGGLAAGCTCHADVQHSGVVLMWGCNLYNKGNTVVDPALTQKRGAKVIAIDPRTTVTTYRLADLHLKIRPGTDAALAHGLARLLIEKGWVNKAYLEHHVQGFFDYRAYINAFTPEYVERITGISPRELENAAHMIYQNAPMSAMIARGAFAQMRNGVQTRRAIEALCAVTGNYDVRGGMIPDCTETIRRRVLREFVEAVPVRGGCAPVGAAEYPLFARFSNQCQMSELARQICREEPYPIRALCAFGLNISEFANDGTWAEALRSLDFFVDTDLFLTRTAKYADIVLPAASSFEREMLRITPDHRIYYTPVAIAPLGEARADLDIICALARCLVPEDGLLCRGSGALYEYFLERMDLSLPLLKNAAEPVALGEEPYYPGEYTRRGYETPSGRYELKSAQAQHAGQSALPEFRPPRGDEESRAYPFVLSVGNRQNLGFHSRTHRIEWIRAMQVAPAVEMHPEDGKLLGICDGEMVAIRTALGAVHMTAQFTRSIRRGMVAVLPDYEEADICAILPDSIVDPCSGVPALRSMSCRIEKL